MPDPSKPPYRVPSMTEVAKVRGTNGFTAVSTFSGAGGSCLGHEMAGFHLAWASEFVPAAQEVFLLNHPDAILDTRDIREVKGSEILEAIGMEVGELDLLDGSPPCASFSTAGKREKGWGKVKKYSDTTQRVDDLFFEYARLVDETRPKVFVAENVSGLVKGSAKGYFQIIMRELKSRGYRVKAKVLDAKWLGVPQSRQRLIFIGVREDLDLDPVYPKPLTYFYSVRDALPWIASVRGGNKAPFDSKGKDMPVSHPCPTVLGGDTLGLAPYQFVVEGAPTEAELAEASSEGYAVGDEWKRTPEGGHSSKYLSLSRAHRDKPSPCVTARGGDVTAASVMHPNEPRKFTIGELKRICAFPDDFELTGSYSQQWERLGRAVPPLMMRAVAEVVRDEILAKVDI